ncbi:MAG: hypothetical protein AAFZ87_04820 [Planctomycetota bacterium]
MGRRRAAGERLRAGTLAAWVLAWLLLRTGSSALAQALDPGTHGTDGSLLSWALRTHPGRIAAAALLVAWAVSPRPESRPGGPLALPSEVEMN